jgi:SAM-dependent methyltransferase
MAEQSHRSDPRVLNRRTLYRDHAGLVPFLAPGMAVLDVGCGTGAIARGIAETVGREGRVVGVDRDPALLECARRDQSHIRNLTFQQVDALALPFNSEFDIVTAARTLQWISRPHDAITQMRNATKPGGRIVILDYNHADNSWQPDPPEEFRVLYDAFLRWREASGWDNRMGDHLPEVMAAAGLAEVQSVEQDEVGERASEAAMIWAHVAESLGPKLVEAGFLTDQQRVGAERAYRAFANSRLERQILCMRTVTGVRVAE